MLRRLFCFMALLAAFGAAPAQAEATDPAVRYYVELVLNGVATGTILPLVRDGDRLIVDAADLRSARVSVDGDGPIDLHSIVGTTATYDGPRQRLMLDVPPDRLPTTTHRGSRRDRVRTVADTGALFAYDVYGRAGSGGSSLSAWTEQRLFGDLGTLSNTGSLFLTERGPARYVRYDTHLRRIDEDRALTITAGDLFTGALAWNGSVRLGGVQVARSWRVRPDLVTVPLPRFAGQAAVPTAVDLYIDGTRQSSTSVEPGRFVLDDLPVVNGAGDLTVVTTDAVGRQVATTVPFYVAPQALRRGLTDFSIDAGLLRRGFGVRNLAYGSAAAAGTVRHGLTQRLTVEAHGEASGNVAVAGAGIVWSPGLWGAVNASVAAGQARGRSGTQITVGYSYTTRRFSVGAEHVERGPGYADLASFDLGQLGQRLRSDRVSGSLSLGRFGSVGIGYLAARREDSGSIRLFNASWSAHLNERIAIFAAVNHDLGRRSTAAQVRLVVPLGASRMTGASAGLATDGARGLSAQLGLGRSAPSDGGLGYTVDAALGGGRIDGQASLDWRARAFRGEAGVSTVAGRTAGWVGMSGAAILMDDAVYIANTTPDAFAIVRTEAPGVPVRFENQKVGVTDRRGRLFVPALGAYQNALYSIDPIALPDGMLADVVERRVALREGTGAVIRMPVRHTASAMATLVDDAGQTIAPGARARFGDGREALVGWGGLLLLEDVQGTVTVRVTRRDGSDCTASLSVPPGLPAFTRLEPTPCR
ncbi:outer membrane usher protein [Sphingomonas jejuensis]|uniref:Outer membrane usher protein n=1 Tax=Sphingomonas jejuensis TaxID=904715 RepID=A0ABX0XM02_9SPHN|nr:fimbria/pilus outer membrane usher protein [Sphingomonas jejuensis]NJC34264.1 outer membrane usher protein [Sphingomonas jejuensis]